MAIARKNTKNWVNTPEGKRRAKTQDDVAKSMKEAYGSKEDREINEGLDLAGYMMWCEEELPKIEKDFIGPPLTTEEKRALYKKWGEQ